MGKLQLNIFDYIPHSSIETGRSIRIGTRAEATLEFERLAAQATARLAEMAQKKAESATSERINDEMAKDPKGLKETATLFVLSNWINVAKSASAAGVGAKAAVYAAARQALIDYANSSDYKAYSQYMEKGVEAFDNKPYKTIQQVFYPRVSEMSPEEVELGKKYNMHRLISFKDLKDFSVAFTRLLIVNRLIEKLYATQFFAKNPAWQASLRWLVEKPSDTNRTDKFLCLLRSLAKSSDITEELLTACDIKISFLSSDQIFPKKVYDQQDYQAKVFEILFKSLNKEDLGFLDFSNQGVMPEKTIREHLQEKRAALLKYSKKSNKEGEKVLPYFQKIDSDRAISEE